MFTSFDKGETWNPISNDGLDGHTSIWGLTAHNPVDLPASLTTATSVTTAIVAAAAATLPGATIRNKPTITAPGGPDANPSTLFPGEVLTANPNTWNPAANSFAFQWYRCTTTNESSCVATGGFGASTYTLADDDVDPYIRAVTRGTNGNGSAVSDLGPATSAILPKQVTNTTPPALAGQAWVGQTLTRGIGSYSGAIESAYTTWQICPDTTGSGCSTEKAGHVDAAGIATLTLNNGHLGKYVRVRIEVDVNDASAPQPALFTSAFSAKVTAAPALVANTATPKIIGVPATNVVLQLNKGTWEGSPTFSFAWLRCNSAGASCAAIAGATNAKYKVTAADVGFTIRAEVTGVNDWGLPVIASTPATPVATATLKPVYVKGGSVSGQREVGARLTCKRGLWSASPAASFSYKWTRGKTVISGATGKTYRLRAADENKIVACVVRASNGEGATKKKLSAGRIG